METIRAAGVLYEQRGPLVFSASVHLAILIIVAIWALVSPEKEPEDFNFELVPPPSGGFAQPLAEQPLQPLEKIKYERQPVEELPTLDDIVLPERAPIKVEVELPPEPAPVEEPKIVVQETKPKPMSFEEYLKNNPDANKVKNVRKTPEPSNRPKVDLTKDVAALRQSLSEFSIANLPATEIESYSLADQSALSGYIASFKAVLKQSVANHPLRGAKLSALVSCDIAANGRVSNVRIVRSSGDPEFDRKVLAGYGSIGTFSRPPKGSPLIGLEIEFVQ
ncbi:TonB family protein [Pelagicoccus albus]|uniref:TonB family protein n=1 Tax=Pelagicoccus albus TaxID=415222 RepID=A0A7X1E7Y8_9BACT|nr:TonB family protein [Pelagicoccus albus]MBC2605691.1 TonB family protein [Pelagicoccus albus]